MSAPLIDSDRAGRTILAHLEGEQAAQSTLDRIAAGCSDPDLLLRGILNVLADEGLIVPPVTRLRGYCRALQKRLEQS